MPRGLKRYQQTERGHFITFSCYRRRPRLRTSRARDVVLRVLEQVRHRLEWVIVGYVVMPEHVHLLVSEPEKKSLAVAIQLLKQNTSRLLKRRKRSDLRQGRLFAGEDDCPFWQVRYYDFNVWSEKKRVEKLKYMHRNPVQRGLVEKPEDWRWSSYRAYAFGEEGPVKLNTWKKIALPVRT
jgi:putative transposase